VEAETEAGSWKLKRWRRSNFCGSGSTLKKEAESGSKFGSDSLYTKLEAERKNPKSENAEDKLGSMTLQQGLEAEAKNILLLPHPCI